MPINKISYKEFSFFSGGSILILIFTVIFTIIFIENKEMILEEWWLLVFLILFHIIISIAAIHKSFYYLEIQNDELIVKNLFFYWFERKYQIKNINSINFYFEKTGKGGWYGIELSLTNNKFKKYGMDGLKFKFWENLKSGLEQSGISVNDNRFWLNGN